MRGVRFHHAWVMTADVPVSRVADIRCEVPVASRARWRARTFGAAGGARSGARRRQVSRTPTRRYALLLQCRLLAAGRPDEGFGRCPDAAESGSGPSDTGRRVGAATVVRGPPVPLGPGTSGSAYRSPLCQRERHHRDVNVAWGRAIMTTVAPRPSEQPVGRNDFARLLQAEFARFGSVRAWMIALCAAAVVMVLVAFLSADASRSGKSAVPIGPGGEAVSDSYMFVHQALVGDGTVTVRVASLSGGHTSDANPSGNAFGVPSNGQLELQLHPGLAPWAKAGIILEPDTNPGTAYAAAMVTGSHGVQLQYNYTHDLPGLAGPLGPSALGVAPAHPNRRRHHRLRLHRRRPLDRDRFRPPHRPPPHGPDRSVRHLAAVHRFPGPWWDAHRCHCGHRPCLHSR